MSKFIQCPAADCREWYPPAKNSGSRTRCPWCVHRKAEAKRAEDEARYEQRLAALKAKGRKRVGSGWAGRLWYEAK